MTYKHCSIALVLTMIVMVALGKSGSAVGCAFMACVFAGISESIEKK